MADPVINGVMRVQVTLPSVTALPEDDIVNTWAFAGQWQQSGNVAMEGIRLALADFYASWGQWRPFELVNSPAIIKFYDLGFPPPRIPFETSFVIARNGAMAAPEEVAACLSFYSIRNLPRHRGRVFLGPLSVDSYSRANGHTRLSQAFREAMSLAALTLRDSMVANGTPWQVVSQVDMAARPITGGWIDNALDTIRKRGPKPTARTEWGGSSL